MNIKKITALVSGICVLAYLAYVYVISESPPVVMSPILPFSELCQPELNLGRYASKINDSGVSKGDVWEKHFAIEIFTDQVELNSSANRNYFSFDDFPLNVVLTSPKGVHYNVPVFYDGGVFKARAHLDEVGEWAYSLLQAGVEIQAGLMDVTKADSQHVSLEPLSIDKKYPSKFLAGTKPFYWVGSKWFASQNIAPCSIKQFKHLRDSQQALTDEEYIAYLDKLVETKHNAILLKIAQFPLMGDGISWDLEWIQRTEWMLKQALERNVYVQVNLFDTWSRDRRFKVVNSSSNENHVLNVWKPREAELPKIKNYLRSIIARLSAFPNVMWELGNEMEHRPNCGDCFIELANQYYIPWIRESDAFDRLIGLSEDVWKKADADVGFIHQTRSNVFDDIPQEIKPLVLNELVFTDDTEPLWRDSTIRDPDTRLAFRRTFWRTFMTGASGAYEATWLNIQEPFNSAVNNVMRDHQHLAEYIEGLNLDINARQVYSSLFVSDPIYQSYSLSLENGFYSSYLLSKDSRPITEWDLNLGEIHGFYEYQWFDPSKGVYSEKKVIDTTKKKGILVDYESTDLVFLIKRIKAH